MLHAHQALRWPPPIHGDLPTGGGMMNWRAMPHSTPISSHRSPAEAFQTAAVETSIVGASAVTAITPNKPPGYALKRPFDVMGAMILLVLLSPLLALIAVLVRATSKGPALFHQERLGWNAQPFTFYKFRTMTAQADERLHQDYVHAFIHGSPNPSSNVYKIQNDPRVTPLGHWLRKTSLDELPQLFNVLRGDMSLVGPRPPLAYEVAQYQPWHMQRLLQARPGMTGLWQVEGRSRVTFDDMVRMDLLYASTCSFLGDLRLLARTIGVVVHGSGGA
jgi:lipopolysaccharide/colanic/teichoic acid biosynthesis glycosyltransferase